MEEYIMLTDIDHHNSVRLYINQDYVIFNDNLRILLDSLSRWNGADFRDKTHVGWEFKAELKPYLDRFVRNFNPHEEDKP